ncbi:MAG: single-stranded-DNA-specific exonuclease RecJ [Desulfuromonadales bacterium GWD2_61_12]|nr:MAG: single-stranded-DNA-specific exonuclease RecJ [Desulfuromonadales bacterium GWC2_61_20]OGR35192.1 MAG: single-stranded-DNA-specific exonuclease RecJ [Desulfuromonadales bacterium GWD2_61_12]HAD04069.1 single-stranded-DNA-specific exonuclease RecJ [Desulfuromonas sp.]HBT83496.1 single-stranded-DNA-specific exonuclease RecJ [Desulfuromonas sp.]
MQPVTVRRWLARGGEPEVGAVATLAQRLGIRPLTARALCLRGICDETAGRDYLDGRLSALPDPFLLSGMAPAVARLLRAVQRGERIAIHGDYDVDGVSGTVLLVEALRSFGAEVESFIPLRLRDGYGLSAEALERAAAAGARVVVSVDCGIAAVGEAARAQELGLDLIITDHHLPGHHLPAAYAVINPHLEGSAFPYTSLAGVGVAFMLLVGLRKALREAGHFAAGAEPDLRPSLDLVALGTIADIVPLTGVNRLLTRHGLTQMNKRCRAGLAALMLVAGVKEANCGAVGFGLAPRLNAAGRLEDAALGVELLLTKEKDLAAALAARLDGINRERREVEQETFAQAVARLEEGNEGGAHSIVLADARWHAGVIGIVASRLVERYHRPTVLIALTAALGKGSARSIVGFHLHAALERCRHHLGGFGGHAMAAGVSLAADEVAAFAASFEAVAGEALSAADLLPRLWHDGELLLAELDRQSVEELATLAPFGAGNPEPAFLLRGVRVQQPRLLQEKHLKFTARQGGDSLPCIAFGMAGRQQELVGELDLLVTPQLNLWQGRTEVQLRIRDLRTATAD